MTNLQNSSPVSGAAARAAGRNPFLDICKLAAAILVVFIHVPFPGELGGFLACCGRCAVPLFFAVSGYFSFRVEPDVIKRRIRHTLGLGLTGIACVLVTGLLVTGVSGGDLREYLWGKLPDMGELARWVLLCVDPFSDPLWYLWAALQCYTIFLLFLRFSGGKDADYRRLYLAGMLLFLIHLNRGVFACGAGLPHANILYRNGVFFGIPMFAMGLFLREYGDQIRENFALTEKKLLCLIPAGILLSVIEWRGIGPSDAHIGSVLTVIALLLLSARYPRTLRRGAPGEKIRSGLGSWPVGIYLLHKPVQSLYLNFCKEPVCALIGGKDTWLRPLAVLGLTFGAVLLWDGLLRLVKNRRGRASSR